MIKEFTLEQKAVERAMLKVNIGTESYMIPLAHCMPIGDLEKLKDDEGITSMLSAYIPVEVVKSLTVREAKQIYRAWNDASKEMAGVDAGES